MKQENEQSRHRKDGGRFTVMSLFSSYGLGDLGVREGGGDCLVMAEYDADRCAFLRRNYPDTGVVEGDIRETKERIIEEGRRRLAGDELFLLVATPPCQGMSSNGKGRINRAVRDGKRAERDRRNELVLPALEVIKQLRPRWIVLENAAEMRTTRIPYKGKSRLILDVIEEELGPDYRGKAEVVEFSGYRVPQSRSRLIAVYSRDPRGVAILDEGGSLLPEPTHARPITVREAIGRFEELDGRTATSSRHDPLHRVKKVNHYDAVAHTPEGRTAFDNPCPHCGDANDTPVKGEGGRGRLYCENRNCRRQLPRPKKHLDGRWVGTKGFKTSYKRMSWDKPAPTVTTNLMVASSDNKLHPDQNRTLSPAEAMVLQTVDQYAYEWGKDPSNRDLCDALGEAVPPLFLEILTRHLIAISNGSTDPVKPLKDRDREPRPATKRSDPTHSKSKKPSTRRQGRSAKALNPSTSARRGRRETRRHREVGPRPTAKEGPNRPGKGH